MGLCAINKWMHSMRKSSEIVDFEFVDPWTPPWET